MSTPKIAAIIDLVAADTGVSGHDIIGPWQQSEAVRARQIACWLARRATHCSYPAIGKALKRDHTTIMHSVRRVDAQREQDSEFRAATDRLLDLLTRPAEAA